MIILKTVLKNITLKWMDNQNFKLKYLKKIFYLIGFMDYFKIIK